MSHIKRYQVGGIFIAWFNGYSLGKSGQIACPIIVNVEPIHIVVCVHVYVGKSIKCERREHSQFAINTHN